jgi:predicted N-acyltransferase
MTSSETAAAIDVSGVFDVAGYQFKIYTAFQAIEPKAWQHLQAEVAKVDPSVQSPFLAWEFLAGLEQTGCVNQPLPTMPNANGEWVMTDVAQGWQSHHLTVWHNDVLMAALPMYIKYHGYGEYVFDHAWARAYDAHDLAYYPKLISSVPYSPIAGGRLIARQADAADFLRQQLKKWLNASPYSSHHVLFPHEAEANRWCDNGYFLRTNIQFHWVNQGYATWDDFLSALVQTKRKKIRAERRKVSDAGVSTRLIQGADTTKTDWDLFYQGYVNTYLAHYSTPYLTREFFRHLHQTMPECLVLGVAERDGQRLASTLLLQDALTSPNLLGRRHLYGRYWAPLIEVPCLHFELCYYTPLVYAIEHGFTCFEGGAQGEHKVARGFTPHTTYSAHYLQQPEFHRVIGNAMQQANSIYDQAAISSAYLI